MPDQFFLIMNESRRSFLKQSAALAVSALATSPYRARSAEVPNTKAARKLNCVQIGCGMRAAQHLEEVIGINGQNLFAMVDPDERQLQPAFEGLNRKYPQTAKPKYFKDYRRMFDEVGREVDAVFIATPNHEHALPALLAMERGINVYCEKPLCHTIAEARLLRQAAAKYSSVATQMGIQAHCEEGYRKLNEYIRSGVIGNVTETHSWTDRSNGGVGPRPKPLPVPAGLDWDVWIGPGTYREYHAELHPHDWHGWHDFGNGSIGNMACHILDGAFWSLDVGSPASMEAEYIRGGSDERYPTGSTIRWDIPARGEKPPLKMFWYEGLKAETEGKPGGLLLRVDGNSANLPPLLGELHKQYPDEEFGSNGTLYVGERGIIYTGIGDHMRVLPAEKMKTIPKPPQLLPRPKNIFVDFIQACQEKRTDTASPFEYGARLTEFVLTGNLAQIAGVGRKLDWEAAAMKVHDHSELDPFIQRKNRTGWEFHEPASKAGISTLPGAG
jgi:predicted dehydrogenase